MVEPALLRDFEIFKGCTAAELQSLADVMREREIKTDSLIYLEKQPALHVYLVCQGILEMIKYTEDTDKRIYLGQLRKGDIFGFGEIFFDQYYISVRACTPCRLLAISKNDFFRVFLTIPSLHLYITTSLAHVARGNFFLMEKEQAENQLKYLLYYYAARHGSSVSHGIRIDHPLSQSRMAEMLNLTREHIARLLRQLKEQEVLLESSPALVISRTWFEQKQNDPGYDEYLNRYFHID